MVEHTDPFYITIAGVIAEHGRQVLCVTPDKKKPAFYYTIGNHLKGAPEFLMIGGFNPVMGTMIMNMISDAACMQKAGFEDGHKYQLHPEGHPVQIWDTSPVAKMEYTRQATEFYQNSDYAVQQIVLPDTKGRYPGEHNCSTKYRVPVLRATVALLAEARGKALH